MEVVYEDTVKLEDRLIITNNWATRVYGQACMDSMEASSLKARIKWIKDYGHYESEDTSHLYNVHLVHPSYTFIG